MAHPPPRAPGVRRSIYKHPRYPCHQAWPMGFGPSASVAQAVTDACVARVDTDGASRLVAGGLGPTSFPVFGTILDDVWALDCVDTKPMMNELPAGAQLVAKVADQWLKFSLEENQKKRVEAQEGEEVQGLFVDPVAHTVGVSTPKRLLLWAGTLLALSQPRPSRRSVDRIVGKMGFCASSRPCLRACFQHTYCVLHEARERRVNRLTWSAALFTEIMSFLVYMPTATMNLAS